MSIRVSESWTARNGHRRTVSMGLGTYALASLAACFSRGIWGLLLLPFALAWWEVVAALWLCTEILLLAVSGGLVLADLARRVIRLSDVTVTGLRWGLFALDVRGTRP